MLRRWLTNGLIRRGAYVLQQFKCFGQPMTTRNYTSNDEHNERETVEPQRQKVTTCLLPGGGLEKLQGGIKEESYFNTHDLELMTKIRDAHGAKLKCEHCLHNWTEFHRMLDNNTPAQMRDTSSLNPHKNYTEEAFFLNEHKECLKLMQEKSNVSKHKINDTSSKTQLNELELEQSRESSSTMNIVEQYASSAEVEQYVNSAKVEQNASSAKVEQNVSSAKVAHDNDSKSKIVPNSNANVDTNNDDDDIFDQEKVFLEFEPKISKTTPHEEEQTQNSTTNSATTTNSKTDK